MRHKSEEETSILAAEYVCGLLDPAAAEQVRRHLRDDDRLKAAVEYWEERLLPLSDSAPEIMPDPKSWPAIERNLQRSDRGAVSRKLRLGGIWDDIAVWRGLAAIKLATIAVLIAILVWPQTAAITPKFVAVLATRDASPGWLVEVMTDNTLRLTPLQQRAPGPEAALQFWTLADPAQGPRSLGLVSPERPTRLPADVLPAVGPGQLFEITLEPPSGSPIGRPTGPVLYIGRTVEMPL